MQDKSDELTARERGADLAEVCRALVPAGMAVAGGPIVAPSDDQRGLPPTFSRKRRAEYWSGRYYALQALCNLGVIVNGLPIGGNRAPVWPDGIVGSISHTDSLCVSVVASKDKFHAVGIDLEENGRVTPDLFSMLFTQRELAAFDRLALKELFDFVPTLAFSAKEAFYKYCSPEEYFDFLDVEIEFDTRIPIFRVRLVNPKNVPVTGEIFYGRWGRFRDHVLTVCCSDEVSAGGFHQGPSHKRS